MGRWRTDVTQVADKRLVSPDTPPKVCRPESDVVMLVRRKYLEDFTGAQDACHSRMQAAQQKAVDIGAGYPDPDGDGRLLIDLRPPPTASDELVANLKEIQKEMVRQIIWPLLWCALSPDGLCTGGVWPPHECDPRRHGELLRQQLAHRACKALEGGGVALQFRVVAPSRLREHGS